MGKGQGGVLVPGWNRREAKGLESRVGSGRLKELVGRRRRTGRGFGGQAQMGEDLGNHRGIFDRGNESHRPPHSANR